jgi:hypothetical protein
MGLNQSILVEPYLEQAKLLATDREYDIINELSVRPVVSYGVMMTAFDNQVLKFGSKYNRLIAFDSKTPHKANSFSVFREPRLTQTFFVFKITSDNFPKTRALQHIYN